MSRLVSALPTPAEALNGLLCCNSLSYGAEQSNAMQSNSVDFQWQPLAGSHIFNQLQYAWTKPASCCASLVCSYGRVKDVRIVRNPGNGESRGKLVPHIPSRRWLLWNPSLLRSRPRMRC